MCETLSPLVRNCGFARAGVSRLWVAKFDENLDWSIVNEDLIINSSLVFEELQLDKDSGTLTSETTLTVNGYITKAVVSATFEKAQASSLRPLTRLLNKKLYCMVLDNNGLYWFLGVDAGSKVSSLTLQTDVSRGFSGHLMTLVSTSSNPYNTSAIIVGGEFNNDFNFDFLS